MKASIRTIGVLGLVVFVAAGCATPRQVGDVERQGIAGGALAGGVIGGIIGNNVGDGNNQVLGAAIGAALGSMVGSQYGRNLDYTHQRIGALETQASTTEVIIQNDNGSITRVRLFKTPSGYMGPRGEEYATLPTPEQLKPYYGLK